MCRAYSVWHGTIFSSGLGLMEVIVIHSHCSVKFLEESPSSGNSSLNLFA